MSERAPKRGKQSAGILAYRRRQGLLEVFLVHPGGPYWASKDQGAWSIPKGEYSGDEAALAAAQREFLEETGLPLSGPFVALPPVRQASGKRVLAWAVEAPNLDPARLRSNCFTIVGSRYAGTYPEVDKAAWFTIEEAGRRLNVGQRPLLDALQALGA